MHLYFPLSLSVVRALTWWSEIKCACARSHAKQYQLLLHGSQGVCLWKFVWFAYFLSELLWRCLTGRLGWVSDTACNKYTPKSLKYLQTPACPGSKYRNSEQILSLFTWTFFCLLFHLKLSGTKVKELFAQWNLIQKQRIRPVPWHVTILQGI